jgi:hypothetical protein
MSHVVNVSVCSVPNLDVVLPGDNIKKYPARKPRYVVSYLGMYIV